MKIQESGENYLEAILVLKRKHGSVRSIDIANHLEFSKPSVSRAMGILKKAELINVDEHGEITFTDSGRERAENIYERHELLSKYLISLGVSEETAKEDACRIEHVISEESFEKFREHAKKDHL